MAYARVTQTVRKEALARELREVFWCGKASREIRDMGHGRRQRENGSKSKDREEELMASPSIAEMPMD